MLNATKTSRQQGSEQEGLEAGVAEVGEGQLAQLDVEGGQEISPKVEYVKDVYSER
jgi:hypothetical protein